MKKIKLIGVSMIAMLLASCSSHWILDKERLSDHEIKSHVSKLQDQEYHHYSNLSVYTIFTISEGRKMVVITSGDESKSLEFVRLDKDKKDQKIIVRETTNESDDINPYLLVGLDKIKGDLEVYNESTNEFITEVDRDLNPID